MAVPAHPASTTPSVGPHTRSDGSCARGPHNLNVPGRREACLRDALVSVARTAARANYSSFLRLFVTQDGSRAPRVQLCVM